MGILILMCCIELMLLIIAWLMTEDIVEAVTMLIVASLAIWAVIGFTVVVFYTLEGRL